MTRQPPEAAGAAAAAPSGKATSSYLDGRLLTQFVCWLPDGRIRTRNAGSGVYEGEPSALYPA